jgi:NhaA family Na+:H+ antiporter
VLLGLVVGKPVGVLAASYLGTRLGFPLPRGLDRRQMAGLGAAAGIGFTVSIFISGLAFDDPALIDEAKIGILAASLVAAALALALLTVGRRGAVARQQPDGPAPDPVFDDELELGDAPTRA